MGKRPSFQFYPGDWLRDPAVRSLSRAARGLWIDMICLMFESEHKGYLELGGRPVTAEQLARMTGGNVSEVARLLGELEEAAVFSRTEDGVIYSRRMDRDEHIREVRSLAGKLGAPYGNLGGRPSKEPMETAKTANETAKKPLMETAKTAKKPLVGGQTKGQNNPPSSSSSSSSSSSGGMYSPLPPSCSEPEAGIRAEAVLTFPTVGKEQQWDLLPSHLQEWQEAFPTLDVLAECRRALAWVNASRGRRKTVRGMPRFLVGWLDRSQNRGAGRGAERNGDHAMDNFLRGFLGTDGDKEQQP